MSALLFLLGSSSVGAQTFLPEGFPKWMGFYAGAGVGMETWILKTKAAIAGHAVTATTNNGGYGAIGTILAGYDYEFDNAMVVGAFVDGTLGSNATNNISPTPGLIGKITESGNWDIGARIGHPINYIVLPYLTAGYSRTYFSNTHLNEALPQEPSTFLSTPGFNVGGWFLGAGLETEIISHWSLRGEYRFTSYHWESIPFNGVVDGVIVNNTQPTKAINQTVQALVTYRF